MTRGNHADEQDALLGSRSCGTLAHRPLNSDARGDGIENVNDSRAPAALAHHCNATNESLSFRQALSLYPKAVFWSLFFSLGVIMSAFDGQLIGNLYATPAFQRDFGYRYGNRYLIPASWQTGLSMGGPLGQALGAFLAAYPMDRFGRKRTFAACVVLTTGCVFIQFFARSLPVLLVGELLSGVVLGSYTVIAPSYASEVCPVALRGVLTAFTNLAFVFGQLLANCVIALTSRLDSHWAYSAAFAVQWAWPAVILVGLPWSPESPWWLQRQDRLEEAEASLQQLASNKVDVKVVLAKIIETDRLEQAIEAGSTYRDCFTGTNRRRTKIATGVYCIQVLSGIYLVGYATYFFQLAGLPTTSSFTLSIIFLLLGLIGTLLSFLLLASPKTGGVTVSGSSSTTHSSASASCPSATKTVQRSWRFSCEFDTGYRQIYLAGLVILSALQFAIAILDCVPSYSTNPKYPWTQALLMLVWNFIYGISLGPLCFVILTSVSSSRVRAKTIALATTAQASLGVLMTLLLPILFNPDRLDARGKIGFLFGTSAALSAIWVWNEVPELKGKDWKEIDLLFESRADARQF